MTNLVAVVTKTVGINENVSVMLEPERCRNCKGELETTADFKYCKNCNVYFVGKWCT